MASPQYVTVSLEMLDGTAKVIRYPHPDNPLYLRAAFRIGAKRIFEEFGCTIPKSANVFLDQVLQSTADIDRAAVLAGSIIRIIEVTPEANSYWTVD